jgi:WD40 repeat protein
MVPREIKLSKPGGNSSIFTPDGALLLYAGNNHINVWNLAEEKQTGTIASARPQLAVSPDGKKLAFEAMPTPGNNSDPVIKIVDLAGLQELHQLSRPPGETTNLPLFRVCEFDGKSSKLFTRTNVDVQVWDAQTGALLRRITPDKPHPNTLATYSLNSQKIVVTYMFFSSVIDTETEVATRINVELRDLERFLGRRPNSWSLGSWTLTADGQTLFGIEAVNGLLLEWSLPEAKLISGIIIPDLVSVKVSPDGTRVLAESKSARNTVHVLDRSTMQIIATLQAPGDRILHCSISPDNRWLFLSGAEENRLYDFGPQPTKK